MKTIWNGKWFATSKEFEKSYGIMVYYISYNIYAVNGLNPGKAWADIAM